MKFNEQTKFGLLGQEMTLADAFEFLKIFRPAIWKCVLTIFISVIFFASIGYIAKKTSPKEYESKCVMYNEQGGSSQNSSLDALALLTGQKASVGMAESTGGDLYQLILTNRPFLIDLAKKPIFSSEHNRLITFQEYFNKEPEKNLIEKTVYKIKKFPSKIISWVTNSSSEDNANKPYIIDSTKVDSTDASFVNKPYISTFTIKDRTMVYELSQRIKLTQSGKLSTLSVRMPEARLSAEANILVLSMLTKYAIRFKLNKQLENIEFLEARTREAEIKYKESQQKVANFKDNNYNVIFQSVQTQENVLQNNFVLYSGIYNQLVSQLEQAKIQLKKDSPLFTIVEPVYLPDLMPIDNSVIVGYLMKGVLLGIAFSFYFLYRAYKKSTLKTINS